MINVAIVGAKSYTGEELIKILYKHPNVKIVSLSGRMQGTTKHICEIYPYLKGKVDILCEDINEKKIAEQSDLIFTALPHKVSMEMVTKFYNFGKKVIDLSADFRLKDAEIYEKWYESKHISPELLKKAVYGLPELYRKKIKKATIIANPGCYPTTIILGCYPVLKEKIVNKKSIIIDSKSGISGAGREFVKTYHSPNTYAYKIGGIHRHIPEIEQELKCLITFTPHVIPQERGMLSTIYFKLKKSISENEIIQIYKKYYENEPFVRIVESAQTKDVENTNYCNIAINIDKRTNNLVITSAIDNLVKGASGQAVQNMNIMSGFDEEEGLI
ncbi:MAG: N-acetyl-gamma-glutamyl-phosphate reductase [Elusimicrobia bacterium RIFOXYD2_FULL_34_15]|nr:MAG: N-acetyl-gamma-glutamyl-phosphate reductase [Elusimicrobia bacterium RIFOXYD2_FULL_34_15]